MTMRSRFGLAGLALLLGGMTAGICHLFEFDSPRDVAHLSQYATISAQLHLVLFAGGTLALLGWFGSYVLHSSESGVMGFSAFVCLFLGILWGDLLHSILEFSVFPILDTEAPYALPGLADATYRSAPLAFLLPGGHLLLLAGTPIVAFLLYRSSIVHAWTAIPFGLTTVLELLALRPQSKSFGEGAMVSLYMSFTILGAAMLWPKTRSSSCPVDNPGSATYREDSRPAAR